jgi:hypothetical protein
MTLSTDELRKLLDKRLRSDADFDAFAIDHFPEVFRRFAGAMDRVQKTNILLVQADRGRLAALLKAAGEGGVEGDHGGPKGKGVGAGQGPLTVLFVAANPRSTTMLDLDREAEQLQLKMKNGKHGDAIKIVVRWAAKRSQLQKMLLEEQPHVLHFSGHGERDALMFEGEDGGVHPVDERAWADLLDILRDNLRLVVLNACESESLAEATVRHIDAAIGMRVPVGDVAAIAFSAAFYQAIAFGRSVDVAFRLGRNELLQQGIAEEETPRLKVKTGVDASTLVLVGTP